LYPDVGASRYEWTPPVRANLQFRLLPRQAPRWIVYRPLQLVLVVGPKRIDEPGIEEFAQDGLGQDGRLLVSQLRPRPTQPPHRLPESPKVVERDVEKELQLEHLAPVHQSIPGLNVAMQGSRVRVYSGALAQGKETSLDG
jgi:hypothetical protein